jgi:GT2 family glycosyltransferase
VPGLSLARNLGLREAKSEIVAFADDDVYFEPGWLDAIVAAFRDHPDADCIGGHTTPHFETAPPDWMESAQKRMYGSTEFGDQSRWMVHPEMPFGVNMAFRRNALVEIGGFDPRLGRIGENLLSCEEILLFQQMNDLGRRCWYCAEARLLHRIPADRTTPEWLIRRMYWQGVSESVLEQVRSPKGPAKLWGEALLWAGRWIVRSITRLASPRHLLGRDRNRDLHARARQARFRGRLRQSVNEALGR